MQKRAFKEFKVRKILISTIVRDREQHLPTWFEQIEKFVQQLPNIEFSLSVYENDSIDNSIQIISQCVVPKYFKFFNFKHEQINTEMYDSARDRPDRVKNLAKARNKTIFSPAIDLNYFDDILVIEPDIGYETKDALKIINYEGVGLIPDVYSGISVAIRDGRKLFYDSWATRRTSRERRGEVFPSFQTVPIREFWSTFNGFCIYNAEPFKKGVSFHWYNERFGTFDCDTAVICERFRKHGYSKIYANQEVVFYHP